MNLTNLHGLPDALVNAIKNDPYQGGGDISVTKLIDSPKRRVLGKKFKDVVVVDVSEMTWALMGQAMHTVLERSKTEALVEKRLYAEVDGWQVSGQFDRVHLEHGVMQDWKVCSVYKYKGDVAWERQLNCLRWLAVQNNMQVDKLQVVAIFRDWKKSEALRNPDYPQQNVMVIDVPVWDLDVAYAYVKQRVALHKNAEVDQEYACTEDERWYSGTTYALMKEGGKRAKRVAASIEELGSIPDGHFVQTRPGISRRCADYCDVAPFCQQWGQEQQQLQQESGNDVD